MLVILFILACIWVGLGMIAWSLGAFFAFRRTPERMARKHPETVDPHTGEQRILADLTEGTGRTALYSEGHHRRSDINRARKWTFRARRHL
jgi:hypothetical protein